MSNDNWALSSDWLECYICTVEVMGSSPIGSTKLLRNISRGGAVGSSQVS